MGLAKIILLVLGLALVYWLVRSYRRRVDRGDAQKPATTQGENMVRCALCGVHLPRSESLTTQGSFYCSAEHQRAHREGRSS
jgi:uncharacterized protein